MPVQENKPIDDDVREQYDKEFDSNWYLNSYYTELLPAEENCLKKLKDIFTQGKLEGPIKRCIDIGCGPTVHRLSAPSKVCDTLVYSDYSSNNLKLVEDWINGVANHPNQLNMFKVCAKLEGFRELEKGANEIENRIKSKVKKVLPINVLMSNPLIGQKEEPFDVAFTAACLEAACDSYESYVAAIKNIATLIRPGGYLLIKGYVGATFYVVNKNEFPVLFMSEEMVKKGLKEGGFEVQEIEILDSVVPENVIDGKPTANASGSIFAVARKL